MSDSLIVRNFGLFWERSAIEWGSRGRGRGGHLKGYMSNPAVPIDFRDQRGIYVLYEGDRIATQRTVYVGQAGSAQQTLFKRLRDHRDDDLWNRWQRFSWFGFLKVGANKKLIHANKTAIGNIDFTAALDQLEAVLIALMEPIKNKQGPRWRKASEYFQYRKSEVESSADAG